MYLNLKVILQSQGFKAESPTTFIVYNYFKNVFKVNLKNNHFRFMVFSMLTLLDKKDSFYLRFTFVVFVIFVYK